MSDKLIILVALISLDLPIALAYNYPPRFFLPLIPLFAALTAMSFEDIFQWISSQEIRVAQYIRYGLIVITILLLIYSGGRMLSVGQLFLNDSRTTAGEYIAILPIDSNIEYTLYPPHVPKEHFEIAFNYPIFFFKFPGQEPPPDKAYEWNTGEEGVEERKPDYIVIDSFTYKRFDDDFTCQLHQVECDFFNRLMDEEANYTLLRNFEYRLPSYLPEVISGFLNPDIRIYIRNSQ